ncbi:rCG22815 [Rattus norvegicus]|uniref:RCG22815 n=1 Tax=Rattus norvegicus TaxID=10116 RepID=A6JYF6_RAT|nr:rCG22815 [Rattus norvegicus]
MSYSDRLITIWWTFLCLARLVLDSLSQAKSSSILRCWIITLTVRKLYPSTTGARTLSPGSPGTPVSIYHSLQHTMTLNQDQRRRGFSPLCHLVAWA